MAEWEEKLGTILNDPNAMRQILSLAQSINGSTPPPAAEPAAEAVWEPVEPAGDDGAAATAEGMGLDPKLMEIGMRALAAYRGQDNDRAALLQALRPFVKPERYAKVDKAVQVARLSKAVRAVLDGLKGGEGHV